MKRMGCPIIDATGKAIEETASIAVLEILCKGGAKWLRSMFTNPWEAMLLLRGKLLGDKFKPLNTVLNLELNVLPPFYPCVWGCRLKSRKRGWKLDE